jgi:endogenous inhibitor of DNA gyrase (YacG/DUF329 family)|tara:strand:- start:18 stop:200 length:183 start_codon:yes stop_codon:yes gene_type:complete
MEINKQNKTNILPLKKKPKCPTCKKVAREPFIPFCSKKCASLDLMKWLNDEYQSNLKIDQ